MFPENQRAIFEVIPGDHPRYADPIIVWRKILEALGGDDLDDIIGQVRCDVPKIRLDGIGQLSTVACVAFDLEPLKSDGTGYSETESLAILWRFFAWENELKKNGENSPSSPELSASLATT